MGMMGRLTGWSQQKDAHNAVLASHLAENADPDLRRTIAERLVLIERHVRRRLPEDAGRTLDRLTGLPRIVQMNFVALACNSLGIPPALPRLSFAEVDNPHLADDRSSLARIDFALSDLSRRSGQRLSWPGNEARIGFASWMAASSGEFRHLPASARAQPGPAATHSMRVLDLVYSDLLLEAVERTWLMELVAELVQCIDAATEHELALAISLFVFELGSLQAHLEIVQMAARLTAVTWLQDGRVSVDAVAHFEKSLYECYR